MRRDISSLTSRSFDLVIIGGGIYGASVARDAALRGLTVALVEQDDFGHATSANNQRIVHGGLRYLQHGHLGRMRQSITERRTLFRIAPHLICPLPFLIPLYRGMKPSKNVFGMALRLNDLIGFDRNHGLNASRQLPSSRLLTKDDCLSLCPLLESDSLYAGGLYYEGVYLNPDRLTLSILQSAAAAGAKVANYVRMTHFLRQGRAIVGIGATDTLTGHDIDVQARSVVNCSGPWIYRFLESLLPDSRPFGGSLLRAHVLVTRLLVDGIGIGVPSREHHRDPEAVVQKGYKYLFIVPWRNKSLVGTYEIRHDGSPEESTPSDREIDNFLHIVNAALPSARLGRGDVSSVYSGLLFGAESNEGSNHLSYRKQFEVRDHEVVDGISGLVSVLGVKFTTARAVAQEAVDLILRKLGRKPVPSLTARLPVWGGEIDDLESFLDRAVRTDSVGVEPATVRHLAMNYGARYHEVLLQGEQNKVWLEPVTVSSPVIGAEVIHGIRSEMAQTLGDVVFRRTVLGSDRDQGKDGVERCAAIMANELGWSHKRRAQEQKAVESIW